MSLIQLTPQTQQRLPTIKAGLLKGTTYDELAKQLNVTEKTIDRDVKAFLQSGQFDLWIREEWLRLHNQIILSAPVEAYKQITRLLTANLTRKVELKEDITQTKTVTYNLNYSDAEKDAILSARRAIINQRGSTTQPNSLH